MTLHQTNFEFTPHENVQRLVEAFDKPIKAIALEFTDTNDIAPAQAFAADCARHVTSELAKRNFEIELSKPFEDDLMKGFEALAREGGKHTRYRVREEKRSADKRRWMIGFHNHFTFWLGTSVPFIGGGYLALTSAGASSFYDNPALGVGYGLLSATPIFLGSTAISRFCTSADSEWINDRRARNAFVVGLAVALIWAVAKALDLGLDPSASSGFQANDSAVVDSIWQTIKSAVVDPLNLPIMYLGFIVADALLGGALVAFAKNGWKKQDAIIAEPQPVTVEIEAQKASIWTSLIPFRQDGGHTRERREYWDSLRALVEQAIVARVRAEATAFRSMREAKLKAADAAAIRDFLDS
ncbi:hypothetical protein [Tritonibacter scottomollicae]|uniref:hypothetical protein n=1 Tax=Tritonibacter scottomollicae TaxID=483013 RepID=UPI003AA911A5